MKFILGKKVEMTQIWKEDKKIAVTKVQATPSVVSQIKTKEKDGYEAVQVIFGERKKKNISKPQLGHFKKTGKETATHSREFRMENVTNVNIGDIIKVDTFEVGDIVNIIGTSKGKGFAGVVKRHHFSGSKKTHGNKDQLRMPGSAGATGPAHVFKGTRMGGRMGGDKVTTKNVEIADVDLENNIIFVKGSVPGARNSLVLISGNGELKITKKESTPVEEVKEEVKEEVLEATKTPVEEVKEEVLEAVELKAEDSDKK